jgi:4-hydroxyphenylpyruvate dioxygenase
MSYQDSAPHAKGVKATVNGIDYLEVYVGNSIQATHYYSTALGFTPIAYAGPETGVRDRTSFVVQQRNIRLTLTCPLTPDGELAQHVNLHGDGIKDIAFLVDSAASAFNEAVKGGARPVMEPTTIEDQYGKVVKSTIATFGDTVHSFIERKLYDGPFLPNYRPMSAAYRVPSPGLNSIDHIAISVRPGQADEYVEFYRNTLAFHQTQAEDVSSEYSAMNTRVVTSPAGNITFVLVEPATGKRKSPIDEYLAYYGDCGVHHIALSTDKIIESVGALCKTGVNFATTPPAYYETLERRVGKISESIETLRELSILVDRDTWGYLMQIFTKPMQSRPTFFYEIIQRVGAHGFGNGNIRALFEAIEREQILRGNV